MMGVRTTEWNVGTVGSRESETGNVKLTGTYRKLVKDTTINDTTLLSTDYLNHYNEFVMMLEIVADMPEMLLELEDWKPKTYQEHFRDSSFQHKDLAIWAYEQAPDQFRVPMDDCIARMDAEIAKGLPRLREFANNASEAEKLSTTAFSLTATLHTRIDMMSALINGALDSKGYASRLADMSLSDRGERAHHGEKLMNQAGIDALFD